MTKELTVATLLKHTVEEGDCLIWTGHSTLGKHPQVRSGGKVVPARREIYRLIHGELPSRIQVGVKCGSPLCVHPDCLIARTRAKASTGKKLSPKHKLRIALTKRAKSTLLTAEDVRAIRASDEPGTVLEASYGLSGGYVSHIRSGKVWKDTASPFFGLGAR